MKFVTLIFFFCLGGKAGFTQVENHQSLLLHADLLREETIYIFARGTTLKSNLVSHKFNYVDTNITHVGIGYIKNGHVLIYNVTDNGNSAASALVIDSITSFIKGEDVFYFSIWECDNKNAAYQPVLKGLQAATTTKIKFDPFFSLYNDALYCSEFCYKILSAVPLLNGRFVPRELDLNNELYENILNTKVLRYFPVDFFQTGSLFTKVYEIHFKLPQP